MRRRWARCVCVAVGRLSVVGDGYVGVDRGTLRVRIIFGSFIWATSATDWATPAATLLELIKAHPVAQHRLPPVVLGLEDRLRSGCVQAWVVAYRPGASLLHRCALTFRYGKDVRIVQITQQVWSNSIGNLRHKSAGVVALRGRGPRMAWRRWPSKSPRVGAAPAWVADVELQEPLLGWAMW